MRYFFIILSLLLLSFTIISCSTSDDGGSSSSDNSSSTTTTTDTTAPDFTVSEIIQTVGSDGLYGGSFVIPDNGISFLLSIFLDNNSAVAFRSLTDPDGTDILSSSSTPNLYNDASGSIGSDLSKYGYSSVLVPQSPSFSAKAGTWTFKAYDNDRVKLTLRTGSTPSSTTISVQPYITGTIWSASDISSALSVLSSIYSSNGITLSIKSTISISDTQYANVSPSFTNSTTSALVKQGSSDAVNIFFIEDYPGSGSGILGNAAGVPGSMGLANSWNGVLTNLTAHASGTTLESELLGETTAAGIGSQLGLFHTTERDGTKFDILSDTPECHASTQDNDSSGSVTAEECEGYGAENLMFWNVWNAESRSAGKKQETLSSHQQYVLKYSPIAK